MGEEGKGVNAGSRGIARTVIYAWLVAGTLDIATASIYYPIRYSLSLTVL